MDVLGLLGGVISGLLDHLDLVRVGVRVRVRATAGVRAAIRARVIVGARVRVRVIVGARVRVRLLLGLGLGLGCCWG